MLDDFEIPDDDTLADELGPVIEPIYERQATLNLHNPSVILIGAGGVGCWTALSLVLGGITNLTIFDGDTISIHNLNRFPLPEATVGEMKSVALANWLRILRPKADIRARGMFDPTIHITQDANWIVCCTDSLKSRLLCYEYSKKIGASYLELGADNERWTLSPKPPEFSTDLEDAPGYQVIPVHVGPCMMAGAAAAYYVLHNCRPIVSHSVNWARGPIILSMPNLGALKFQSVEEIEISLSGRKLFPCPDCDTQIERNLILIIKHYREHNPEIGLAEAKAWAEQQLSQINTVEPIPLTNFDDGIEFEDRAAEDAAREMAEMSVDMGDTASDLIGEEIEDGQTES